MRKFYSECVDHVGDLIPIITKALNISDARDKLYKEYNVQNVLAISDKRMYNMNPSLMGCSSNTLC